MSEPTKKKEETREYSPSRAFVAMEVLPNVAESYAMQVRDLSDAIQDSDVVLDTNVLLLPYGAGSNSLKAIIKVYTKLHTEKRLHMPAQVIREFIKNRPTKIADLYKGISDKVSRIEAPDKLSYTILEDLAAFCEINEKINNISLLIKDIKKSNRNLLETIRNWECNDPVSLAYKQELPVSIIKELPFDREKMLSELQHRYNLGIPPGYKDKTKEDYGIGDLLIWKTILLIGSESKKDMIFVSGEEKSDWQHRSDGTAFLPRYELLDEYRRSSGGRALYIIPLSKLLELLNVEETSIEEIKQEEARVVESTSVEVSCPHCNFLLIARLSNLIDSTELPKCPNCKKIFQIHRKQNSITVQIPFEALVIDCPSCDEIAQGYLGFDPSSTGIARCTSCRTQTRVYRGKDGFICVDGTDN